MRLASIVIVLFALPFAVAAGIAFHQSRSEFYAEQAQSSRSVWATVTSAGDSRRAAEHQTTAVPARWTLDGVDHSGVVVAHRTVKPGDVIRISVDRDGIPLDPPVMTVLDEAVLAAVVVGVCVSALGAAGYGLIRAVGSHFPGVHFPHFRGVTG